MSAWDMRRLVRAYRRGALYPCAACRNSGSSMRVSRRTSAFLAKLARAMNHHCVGCAIATLVKL